jgi:hypothetical protein
MIWRVGAVWPDVDRDSVARNVYLEIQAGSTGRPNSLQGPMGQHNAPGGPPTSGITAPRIPAPIRLVPPPPGSSGLTPGTPGGGPRLTPRTGQATP